MSDRGASRRGQTRRLTVAFDMKSVTSSNVKAIGHDPETNTTRVEFHSGAVCDYPDSSADECASCCGARSVGKAFYRTFVATKRPFKKVT